MPQAVSYRMAFSKKRPKYPKDRSMSRVPGINDLADLSRVTLHCGSLFRIGRKFAVRLEWWQFTGRSGDPTHA
jgi:hypothetical protein